MKSFLKQVLVAVVTACVCVALLALVLFGVATGLRNKTPTIKKGSILAFNLSVNITDSPAGLNPTQVLQDALEGEGPADSVQLYPILRALEQAATDDRIAGLHLYGSLTPRGYGSGYGALKELRAALERFKKSGKPIHAYLVNPTARDYYLASVANSIVLNPFGYVLIGGLVSERTFYAGALNKYGVGVQVVRVGKYKSYVEPFILDRMSPENREQTRQLLAAVWDDLVQSVSQDRSFSPGEFQRWVDAEGAFQAESALAKKLVDKIAYFDEELAALKKLAGQTDPAGLLPQVDLASYTAVARKRAPRSANKIVVVYAEGVIVDGEGGAGQVGGDSTARELRKLREDKSVKAIVLRVNSPGGSATASEVIQRELKLAKSTKPVVVSMGTVAASGGYWISAGADRIFAEPNTITGSIGILGMIPNVKELANRHGITWDSVKTGKYADFFHITRPKTAEEMALFQRVIDEGYDKFIQLVAAGRNKTKEAVDAIAQGRVWSGRDAEKQGLVDELGGLGEAIAYAARKARLGSDWSVTEVPREKSLAETLAELLGGEKRPVTRTDPVTSLIREMGEDLQRLRSLNDPLGVYALMPETIRIK